MNLTKADQLEILDEQRQMILRQERQVADWRQIVSMSAPGSTHRFALERAERRLAGVQKAAMTVLSVLSQPAADDVDAIMRDTVRIAHDPTLFSRASMHKAQLDDDEAGFVDEWAGRGQRSVALTNTLAKMARRGMDLGIDVMAELRPAIRSARS